MNIKGRKVIIAGVLGVAGVALAYIPILSKTDIWAMVNPIVPTNQFYTQNSSQYYPQTYDQTQTQIAQDFNQLQSSNPILNVWLRDLSEGEGTSVGMIDSYARRVYYANNSAALLGYMYGYYNDKKTNSDYNNLVNQVLQSLQKNNVGYNSSSSLNVPSALKSLYTFFIAGQSYGHIYAPFPHIQAYNQTNPALYSFRVGQQALRDGTVKYFIQRITLLENELQQMYSNYNGYCNTGNINNFQTDWSELSAYYDYNSADPQLQYPQIVSQLQDTMLAQQDMDRRMMQIQCANLLANITRLKLSVVRTQIQLAQLSAQYGILEDIEAKDLQ